LVDWNVALDLSLIYNWLIGMLFQVLIQKDVDPGTCCIWWNKVLLHLTRIF